MALSQRTDIHILFICISYCAVFATATRSVRQTDDSALNTSTSGYFRADGTAQPLVCLLVPWTGPCRAYFVNWYFDVQQGTCTQFVYGGCMGNRNRFQSYDECMDRCVTGASPQSTNSF